MADPKIKNEFRPGRGYSKKDWEDVSDSPEWTAEDFKNAKSFSEVFPEWAKQSDGAEQGGIEYVGIDLEVVEKFRDKGPDWSRRMNEILRKAAGL